MGMNVCIKRPLRTLLVLATFMTLVLFSIHFYFIRGPHAKLADFRERNVLYAQNLIRQTDSFDVTYQNSSGFVVDTPHCKIPDVNAFDDSIQPIIRPPSSVNCGTPEDVTFQERNVLKVNHYVIGKNYGVQFKHCCYRQILRTTGSDQSIKYSSEVKCFVEQEIIPFEFIKVVCYTTEGEEFFRTFHAFVQKQSANEREAVSKPIDKLNVLIVGVDSVSRLNFIRQMPQTREFLLKQLSAIELKGYNKVADNTFVNIVPMFTGKFLEELPWDESKSMEPFDKHPMVWKDFSSRGYKTLFAEDFPKIAIFNYLKFGFRSVPTTHYLRPFTLAMAAETKMWRNRDYCFGARLETDMVLDYTRDFAKTYANEPYFGLTFITRLTHSDINDAGFADKPHVQFLQRMKAEGLLNNTVLFYISDHGARYGPIVSTYIGKLEERLPLMYVAFPDWFLKKYPAVSSNLAKNSRRLTTPFDIYSTFVHLLNFNGEVTRGNPKDRSISILNEIPEDRTCDSASILPHWCACQNAKPINSKSKEAIEAGEAVVEQINNETRAHRDICEPFSLEQVTDAMKMQADEKVLKFKQSLNDVIDRKVFYGQRARGAIVSYLLTVKATPGGGLFEATVRHDEYTGNYQVMGDMSRIDKYGEQSHCVDVHRLKKFCLCKDYRDRLNV